MPSKGYGDISCSHSENRSGTSGPNNSRKRGVADLCPKVSSVDTKQLKIALFAILGCTLLPQALCLQLHSHGKSRHLLLLLSEKPVSVKRSNVTFFRLWGYFTVPVMKSSCFTNYAPFFYEDDRYLMKIYTIS